jgi:RNA polymerase sigma-70 factor (ECF subfamily)
MRRAAGRSDAANGNAIRAESDEDLIADLRSANGDALACLLRRYGRLVYRVAVDILRDAGEAEDVTQEVFLEIYRKSHLYDPARGTVKVWLLQYAYHRTLRRKSTLKRRAAYDGEPLDAIAAKADLPRNRLTRQECRWLIRKGLSILPERQRATLELTCLEELPLRDVADRLRVSLGCARHYYYRGLARLRAWIVEAGGRSTVVHTAASDDVNGRPPVTPAAAPAGHRGTPRARPARGRTHRTTRHHV